MFYCLSCENPFLKNAASFEINIYWKTRNHHNNHKMLHIFKSNLAYLHIKVIILSEIRKRIRIYLWVKLFACLPSCLFACCLFAQLQAFCQMPATDVNFQIFKN